MEAFLPEPTDLIRFKPVNTENWVDFESFFQSRRSYCWCMAWRMTPEERKENNAGCRKEFMKTAYSFGIAGGDPWLH